ncbi:MAG TPA: adenosylcobinamide-GDP ribazoletransferase [Actinomycetota bacterium]|jgi:adenosylcobinamide-GDP ribazoletransferase|nr:adenosylcobinamide-GDP ribazoletransferase [Actinomycetota bacterium]
MRERTWPVVAALSFLTAVPVARGTRLGERDLRRGVVLFPVVGAAVGAVVAAVAWGAAHLLPTFPAAILGIASGVAVTAALHLDGLGDVADGIGASLGGREPVEAMRDPRLGTFGMAAVALDLLLKSSLLAALVVEGFPWEVVAVGAISRAAPVALAWRLPYVGSGTGGWTDRMGPGATLAAFAIATAISVPTAGLSTLGVVLAVVVVAFLVGAWSRRRLGGVTGDVFGAAVELGETAGLLAVVAWR